MNGHGILNNAKHFYGKDLSKISSVFHPVLKRQQSCSNTGLLNKYKFKVEVNGSCLKCHRLTVNFTIKSKKFYAKNGSALVKYLFGAGNLTKNADPDKYSCLDMNVI